ncbi:MAG TPA: hypothetical protein VFW76_09260 [Ktedonobacterales bacterium]|nr:hypothetical protein [Ktedonobacterales bacterium]
MQTPPSGSNSRGTMPAAVAASTLVLLALTVPLLLVFVVGLFVQPTASALPSIQPTPTVTVQMVLTVAPMTEATPTATVKSSSGGGGQHSPTATPRAAPTATPVPPTPIPTVPIGGG